MNTKMICDQLIQYFKRYEIPYVKRQEQNSTIYDYIFPIDGNILGPFLCRLTISNGFATCITELGAAVTIDRRAHVDKLIQEINEEAFETFQLDYERGIIIHYTDLDIQILENCTEQIVFNLAGWGAHVFSFYNNAFYAVMMRNYDPELVMACMDYNNDIEFSPDGNICWYLRFR